MNDELAVARLKQGDRESLEVLVSHYYLPAVRAAYLIIQDQAAAEDVVQAAFLRLEKTIYQVDPHRPFGPWFMRCVLNAAINWSEREQRLVSLDKLQEGGVDGFDPERWLREQSAGPAERAEAAEQRQAIWQALRQLNAKQRATVVMRYYLELSEVETAARLECSQSSVKWWLYTARARLRELLKALEPAARSSDGEEKWR